MNRARGSVPIFWIQAGASTGYEIFTSALKRVPIERSQNRSRIFQILVL